MKFNRTSYLTRLAALSVATATLIVPLSGVPSAYAQDSYAGSANLQSESQQEIEKAVKNASSKPLTLDELRLNPNVAKILDESKKSSNNNELSSTAPVKVIVTLKNQRHLASDFAERANKAKQNDLLSTWKDKYSITVNRQLGYLVNAFEATLPENKIQALQNEPEVASVAKERVYYPLENTARTLEGVTKAFEQKHKDLDGRGMLVAIVDTGIDVEQPDMKLTNNSKLKMQRRAADLCGSTEFTEKVPDGYNFADENCNVKDAGKEQHGMHVAGIVAANGKIKGVAPNAQLLAMKVFSNDPNKHGADDADIAAAVEASVKLGADIINMSLGSDNGMSGMSSVTGLALKHAREAGILPVISAGNSGLNFSASGTTDDAFGKWDDGTLGSPAAFNEAFSIASVENSVITASKATYYANNKPKDFVYSIATGSADGGKHEIVYAGLGRTPSKPDDPDDFKGVDCNGKYVLIQRGGITFADKFNNAIEKGAAGVIIYNNKPDDLFIGMGGLEKVKIFGASIPMSVGEEIKSAIENAKKDNKKVEVSFTNENTQTQNPSGLHPSTFTSWGPTPELDFKPHIAGIGGNVWSTQNGKNNYIGMSGTSMAAPNVSGLSALVMQSYKNRFPHLSAKALATRVEQALMNTAQVLKNDNGVPYAPRQIGAGLAQVDKAVDTNVIATVDDTDNAYAQLRQVNGPRTISVKLHNIGNSDAQFDIPDNQVINESNEAGQKTVTSFSNESLTTLSKHVRVAPGKTETVKFTLNPKTNGDHYVEGYIGFESTTEGQPNLSVPYLGFVGDWNKESIIVDPNSTYSADIPATTKLVSLFNEGGLFGNLPMKVNTEGQERSLGAFSPNDDGMLESVKPSIAVLRNAERVNYSVYDKDGKNLVIDLGDDDYLSRTNLGKMDANGARSSSNGTWDGKVWDPKKGFVVAKDGYYTYRIKAQLSKDFPAQEYDMKFALDTTGPTIKISDRDENGDVTFTMHDDLIGTPTAPSITVNGGESQVKYDTQDKCKSSDEGHTLTCTIPIDPSAKFIVAKSFDNAFNQTAVAKVFNKLNSAGKPAGSSKIVVNNQDSLTTNTLTPRDYRVKKYGDDKDKKYYLILSGYLSDDVKSLRPEVAHGKWDQHDKSNCETGEFKIDSEHATFVAFVPLKNGDNVIKISGLDANGNKIAFTKKFTVKFNEKAPEITVTNLNANKHLDVATDGKVTIKGKVSDDPGDKLTLKIEYQKVANAGADANSVSDEVTLKNGEFDTTIDPDAKAATVTLVAFDGANKTTLTVPLEGRSEPEQENSDENTPEVGEDDFSIDKSNLQEIFENNYVVSANNPSKDSVKVTGNAGELITSIKFVQNEVGTDKHMNLVVYEAKIDKTKHTFEAELPMHAGLNDFRLEVEKKGSVDDDDEDATTLVNTPVRFYFDVAAPKVTFNNPTLYGHTLFTNKDSVNLAGEISDDAFGYSLYINGNTVKRFFSIHAGGEGVNKRAFSSDIHVDNGDLINVQSSDQIASSKIGLIPVVLDQEDPTVNIGLLDGEEVKDPDTRKIYVHVTDPNLKSVKVYIDNQLVKTEETDLKQTKIEDNMVDTKEVSKIPTDADSPQNTDMKLYIPTAGLKKGDHTLRVEATDYAGNLTGDTSDNAGSGVSRAFTVTQDSTAPAEGSSEPGKKDGSTQTEPEPGKSDGSTQTEPEPGKSDGSTQTEPAPGKSDGSTQTEPEPAPAPGKNGPTPVTGGGSTPTEPATPTEPGKTDPTPVTGGGSTQTEPETPSGSYSGTSSSEETGSESSESSAPSAPSFEGIQSDLKVLTVNESNGVNHLNTGRMNRFHVKGNDFTDGEHAYAFIYSDPVALKGEGNNDYVTMHSEEGGYYFDAFIPEGYEGEHTVLLMKGNTQVASAKAVVASETKSSGSSDSEGNSGNDSTESASSSASRSGSRSFTKGSKSRVAHTGVNIVSVMTMIMVLLTGFVSVLSVRMSKVFVSRKADNL